MLLRTRVPVLTQTQQERHARAHMQQDQCCCQWHGRIQEGVCQRTATVGCQTICSAVRHEAIKLVTYHKALPTCWKKTTWSRASPKKACCSKCALVAASVLPLVIR